MIHQKQLQVQNYLDGNFLNFEQTKIWVKQQMLVNKSPTPKRVNRSQEFKNMKELASHPMIQNYCNQKTRFSQNNLQRCQSIVSLNNLDEPQSFQLSQKTLLNQSQVQNSINRQLTNKNNCDNQDVQNKDTNNNSKLQNKQRSLERSSNHEEKNVINIHVDKLKKQKLQKFGQMLKGLVSQKLQKKANNKSNSSNITEIEQPQENNCNQTKHNPIMIQSRPVSAANTSNIVKKSGTISPMSRIIGITNNSVNQNNTSFKNENSFILNLRIQSPNNQLSTFYESLNTANNTETPQSRKNSFQKLIIRPNSCKNAKIQQYSTLNQSISLTQQPDQFQSKPQEEKSQFQIKVKDGSQSPAKIQQIAYSTPQNQQNNLLNKPNNTHSHKFLFYKTQNSNQFPHQNEQNTIQNFQNQTLKKKLMDIHSVKETEEDTIQIQKKQKILNSTQDKNSNQPKQGNMKFLQKLIQKIGAQVQDEKAAASNTQQDKQEQQIKLTQSIDFKKDNCDSQHERKQSIQSSAENFTCFLTAVQSNFISQKQSFHNSQVNNSQQNNSQIINSSPVYNNNQTLLFKKQSSLIQAKQLKQSSPQKVTSQLISSDLNSILEKNIISHEHTNNENNINIGKICEHQREFSPIQKSRKLSMRQLQFENASDKIKNNKIILNQSQFQQITQSNRKLTFEDASSIVKNSSSSKINFEQKDENIVISHSRGNSAENQLLQTKNKNQQLNKISEEVIQQQKENQKFKKIQLKSSQSSTNLEITKVDFIKQKTFEQPKLSQNPSLPTLQQKKYGSMADLNAYQNKENETGKASQNDQKQFLEMKKEIMKNIIQEQKMQTLENNTVIENSQQFQKLNSFQRKIVNKQYLDFLKNFKQFQKGISKY